MSEQSITIKIVTAPPFKDLNSMLTPRFKLVVSYTKGGVSFLTGQSIPKGYDISVQYDRISDKGVRFTVIDGKGNPTASLEPAARFSAKTLERIADNVRFCKHDQLIAQLYAKAKENRPEYAWPDSILPIMEPSQWDCTSEASLHAAVSEVVGGDS
jgi:hypothetical protein